EHLFFKGTERRNSRELMHAIESRGGHMNAFTSREYTCLYVKTLSQHLPMAMDVLSDVLNHSIFCDLEKERSVILEEIAAGIDVPEEYVHDLLTMRLWPDHALGRPIAGSVKSVSAIGLEDVKMYKNAWYQPGNLTFCIAGNFDQADVLDTVRQQYGDLGNSDQTPASGPPPLGNGMQMVDRDIAQDHVTMAFPVPGIGDGRRYVYDMLSSALGGGSTSRLFDRIREEEGLAYSIYSFHSGYKDAGALGMYAAVAPENLKKAVELSCEELRKIKDEPLDAEELASNAEQLKGGLLLALEGSFNRMSRIARSLLYFDRIIPIDEVLDAVDAVTAEQIQTLAQKTFTEEQCAMTVLGPSNGPSAALSL
ncbi:MAG: pitrilysin family protein, partial [Candidatus Hydrogenedentes bacterium]|nr:pitrilysin family protein [Candidatus Hydrogenedentota bacterium]